MVNSNTLSLVSILIEAFCNWDAILSLIIFLLGPDGLYDICLALSSDINVLLSSLAIFNCSLNREIQAK